MLKFKKFYVPCEFLYIKKKKNHSIDAVSPEYTLRNEILMKTAQ